MPRTTELEEQAKEFEIEGDGFFDLVNSANNPSIKAAYCYSAFYKYDLSVQALEQINYTNKADIKKARCLSDVIGNISNNFKPPKDENEKKLLSNFKENMFHSMKPKISSIDLDSAILNAAKVRNLKFSMSYALEKLANQLNNQEQKKYCLLESTKILDYYYDCDYDSIFSESAINFLKSDFISGQNEYRSFLNFIENQKITDSKAISYYAAAYISLKESINKNDSTTFKEYKKTKKELETTFSTIAPKPFSVKEINQFEKTATAALKRHQANKERRKGITSRKIDSGHLPGKEQLCMTPKRKSFFNANKNNKSARSNYFTRNNNNSESETTPYDSPYSSS